MAYDIDTYVKPIDYDEFHLTELDTAKWPWVWMPGGTNEFTGTVWRLEGATSADLGQAVTGPIDCYWKTTLPASPDNLANNSFWINDPDYYHYGQLSLAYGDFGSGDDYYVGAYWDADGDDEQVYVQVSQTTVYLRCRYDPELGMAPRFFYALSTPYWENDWTEIPSTKRPEIGALYEIAIQFGAGTVGEWASFDYFRGWSVAHQVDEFDDESIGSFWDPEDWNPPDGEHADGYIYKTYAAYASFALYQKTEGSFDLWSKVDIGDYTVGQGNSLGGYFGLSEMEYFDNMPAGAWLGGIEHWFLWFDNDYLTPADGEGLFLLFYAQMWNDGSVNWPTYEGGVKIAEADAEGLALDALYFRIQWNEDTNTLRYWWSLTEPATDDDWTELLWDVPQESLDYYDDSYVVDGVTDWNEMRAILRTVDLTPTSPVGYYMWVNPEYIPNEQRGYYVRNWPRELVFDEFNDAVLGPHWEPVSANGSTVIEQEGRLRMSTQWGGQAGVRQSDLPIQDYDIWTRFELSPEFAGEYGDLQFWFEDTGWDGDGGIWFRPLTTEGEWEIGVWMDSDAFGNYFEVNKTIYQNYVYLRLKLDYGIPSMAVTAYYALREPQSDSDWVSLGTIFPDPGDYLKAWEPTGRLFFYQMCNPDNSGVWRTGTVAYWRKWWLRGHEAALPPSLDQYQRLQGYPKVTHPLVFNRNIGQFEVMEQPRSTSPSPTVDADYDLAYDASGNLETIYMVVGGITYRKTLSYDAVGSLIGVSTWIEQ